MRQLQKVLFLRWLEDFVNSKKCSTFALDFALRERQQFGISKFYDDRHLTTTVATLSGYSRRQFDDQCLPDMVRADRAVTVRERRTDVAG